MSSNHELESIGVGAARRSGNGTDQRFCRLLSFFAGIFTALAMASVSLWGCGSPGPANLPAVSATSGGDNQNTDLSGLAPMARAVTVEVVRGPCRPGRAADSTPSGARGRSCPGSAR